MKLPIGRLEASDGKDCQRDDIRVMLVYHARRT